MEEHAGLVRAYGLREIVSGVASLAMPDPALGVWTRVGGDAMDLAALRVDAASRTAADFVRNRRPEGRSGRCSRTPCPTWTTRMSAST